MMIPSWRTVKSRASKEYWASGPLWISSASGMFYTSYASERSLR